MNGQVRGFDMLSMRKFVRQHYGEDGVRTVIDWLAARSLHTAMTDVILPNDWRPEAEWDALMIAIDELFTQPGGERAGVRLGRFTCEDQMRTVHRVLMRLLRPGWLLENAAAVWDKYHDHGQWEIVRRKNNIAAATLSGVQFSPIYCVVVSGWFERFFQLCGCRDVRIAHTECVHKGGAGCRFEASWQ